MSVQDQALESKVILVGRTTVGKTCIVNAALTGTFSATTQPTVGAGFSVKMYEADGSRYLFQIWDTAGHERFRSMTPLYYRGAAFALIVFAIDDPLSFAEIDTWRKSLTDSLTTPVFVILVGNKSDLAEERAISDTAARLKADEIQAQYIEVSAKTGAGIDEIFGIMAEELRQDHRIPSVKRSSLPEAPQPGEGCC
jgi:small GTP-binding protein